MSHVRELDSRTSNGSTITLTWNRRDGSVWVTVEDARNPINDLTVRVRDQARAREVFEHPYAFALEPVKEGAR